MRRNVTMQMSEKFYNKFEKERIEIQRKLGIRNLSQPKFSEMIAQNFNLNKQKKVIRRKRR